MTAQFTTVNIYRVPRENGDAFLQGEREAAAIYLRNGALAYETFASADLATMHGCAVFADALDVAPDEALFFGLCRCRDRAHYEALMATMDNDERINALFDEMCGLLDLGRIVRGAFERVI